jgi:hypothetical protein
MTWRSTLIAGIVTALPLLASLDRAAAIVIVNVDWRCSFCHSTPVPAAQLMRRWRDTPAATARIIQHFPSFMAGTRLASSRQMRDNVGECSILCSPRMWRMVRCWHLRGQPSGPAIAGCRLGPWAATVSEEDDRKPVLAIDVGTHLTVAFPLGKPSEFHTGFAAALGAALEDLDVASEQIAIEQAAVTTLSLARLTDARLRETLNTVSFMCGLELSYVTDLRTVQRRLNDFPHDLPPYYVPEAAVRSLFGVPWRDELGDVH